MTAQSRTYMVLAVMLLFLLAACDSAPGTDSSDLSACDTTPGSTPSNASGPISYEVKTVYHNSDFQNIFPIAFSPSGDRILLSITEGDGSDHPATINRDGSDFRKLTDGPGERRVIDFSPDGSKVLYSLGKEIFVVGTDGSEPVLLVGNEGGNDPVLGDNNPVAFSPDGTLLLYNTFHGYGNGWQIHIANADGSNPRQLTDFASSAVGFSPDGSKILFTHTDGAVDVWTMDPDGKNQVNLTSATDPQAVDYRQIPVSFTADGCRILYWDTGSREGVMLMDRDGRNKTIVTESNVDVATAGSPDGTVIAFYEAAMIGICPYCSSAAIGLVRNDGTGRTILDDDSYTRIVDFSPDGRHALLGGLDEDGRSRRVLVAEI